MAVDVQKPVTCERHPDYDGRSVPESLCRSCLDLYGKRAKARYHARLIEHAKLMLADPLFGEYPKPPEETDV